MSFKNMRAVVQRVSQSSVTINKDIKRGAGQGLVVLLGVGPQDSREDITWLAAKIIKMRIFEDDKGKMNRSLMDIKGEVLVISQFTLFASTKKGNRPSFDASASPDLARPLYEYFCSELERLLHRTITRGEFGAYMEVALVNDGPVTIVMDSRARE